jgi:putative sigma-54 modulation protein
MEVVVRGKHITVPEQIKDHARTKFGKLDRYLPLLREADVEISREGGKKAAGQRYVVQVTVNSDGTYLRAEERARQPRAAIDQAADVMARQIRRHKQRLYGRSRSTLAKEIAIQKATPAVEEPLEEEEDLVLGKVVKVKRFPMKPMTEEEALEQMELLGHTFFLFLNAATNRYALLYRRRDGQYGMIIPEAS